MKATRKEAAAVGDHKYFTGEPCRNGHIDLRFTKSGVCMACARDKAAKWSEANKDHHLELKRQSRLRRAEQIRLDAAAYRVTNKDKKAAQQGKRRASQNQRTPAWADKTQIGMWYSVAEVLSRGGVGFHVDHVLPLHGKTVSGLHTHDNLQVLPWFKNLRKSAKLLEQTT